MAEHQILKRNSELLNEKLNGLALQLTDSFSPSKRKNNEILFDVIKSKVLNLADRNEELENANSKLKIRLEDIKAENADLLEFKEEKEEEVSTFQQRMQKMLL